MDLLTVIADIADVLKGIDSSRVPFKQFQPGVGPYGEPQLVKLISEGLNRLPRYGSRARTRRTPDLLIENVGAGNQNCATVWRQRKAGGKLVS